jgi:hypothetical protein
MSLDRYTGLIFVAGALAGIAIAILVLEGVRDLPFLIRFMHGRLVERRRRARTARGPA